MNAQIVKAWQDGTAVYLAAVVAEAGRGNVEYIGSVPLADFQALPDAASKKAALVAAVKAVRDAQTAGQTVIATISGTVTV